MATGGQWEPKLDVKFVLTDIGGSPPWVYERTYRLRGDSDKRLQKPKAGLGADRTSCHRLLANESRELLVSAD